MDLRPDLADDLGSDAPSWDDAGPANAIPPTPTPPRDPSGGPVRRASAFAPWFFAIAAVVGIERVSMVLVTSESVGTRVQLAALAVFVSTVFLVLTVGAWLFIRQFR